MSYMFSLVQGESGQSLSVLINGKFESIADSHPNFKQIVENVLSGEPIEELIHLAPAVYSKLSGFSDRFSLDEYGNLFFDFDPVEEFFNSKLLELVEQQKYEEYGYLVKFYEKLMSNPSEHSRVQLYKWLYNSDFSIDQDGNIVMYKGVQLVDGLRGVYQSVNSGTAIVNGTTITGQIPQKVGDVVTMPRSDVNENPSQGCSTGLHAATWDYATSFAPHILTVSVNPADVVSVPTDCDAQKVRVCRYIVTDVVVVEHKESFVNHKIQFDSDEDEWYEESCEYCGSGSEDYCDCYF